MRRHYRPIFLAGAENPARKIPPKKAAEVVSFWEKGKRRA
jgi:hypothetical protein